MKILQIPETEKAGPASAAPSAPAQSSDYSRVEAVEEIAKSILQRIHAIEERIKALEQPPVQVTSLPLPSRETSEVRESLPPITMDASVLKKDLFAKMWKY